MLAWNYNDEEDFNNVIIALLSIISILNLRATGQQLAAQRNDNLYQFNMLILESLDGISFRISDTDGTSDLLSNNTIATISMNSSSENNLMRTNITDDLDTTVPSQFNDVVCV